MSGSLPAMNLLFREGRCAECTEEWGPPPDSILSIPPPPFPIFMHQEQPNDSALCSTCVWAPSNGVAGVEFVELPRQGTSTNDTWFLLAGASFTGVLILGALLAIILLKCRSHLSKSPVPHTVVSVKAKGCESVLYPYPVASQDGRVLWAAITAKGTTQHYTTTLPQKPSLPPPEPPVTFDNSGFVDSDSQTPLMESYQLSELIDSDSTSSSGTLRPRPRVSTPTRIENPNMPPLNALPHRTLRRATVQRRNSDLSSCPSPL